LFTDVAGKDLMLMQALDYFPIKLGKLADLVFQNLFDVILPEFVQIILTDKSFIVPVGHAFLDEFSERGSDQLRGHAAVRRFRFFANLADKCGGCGFAHRISLLN
jgi:hypothetical protein